jgi:acetyltransferase-like isoleucine patch superfamily enzyme
MRVLLLLVPLVPPGPLKRAWYRRVLGWKVGRRVRIGLSFLDAVEADIGDDVHIGHFNVMRQMARFVVGRNTYIANLNTFTGNSYRGPGWKASVVIGDGCFIMSRHLFDAGGEIRLGPGTTVAGRDTHLWTHTLRRVDGKTELVPADLETGRGCYIGARSTLLYCTLPDGCLVGAGSVVTLSFEPGDGPLLIAGNPARVCRTYPPEERSE